MKTPLCLVLVKNYLFVFAITLLAPFHGRACDETSTTITNVIDNGNGTWTLTVNLCVEPDDFTGSTTDEYFQFSGANIVSASPNTIVFPDGTIHTKGVISGGSVTWSGQAVGTGEPQACFTFTFVVSAIPTSLNTENGHSGCSHTATIPTFTTLSCSQTGGFFYDPGGPSANYGNNLNQVTTICPDAGGSAITVSFTGSSPVINTDAVFSNCADVLSIYQGASAAGTLVGAYCETYTTAGPLTIVSTDATGCLTFQFVSDGSTTRAGWNATVTCTCIAPAAPAVSAVNLCQGDAASALTATASSGGTLNWYGTNATGGTASSTAPTPASATVGTTTYYVSQTVGGCEGPRAAITVTVSAGTAPSYTKTSTQPSCNSSNNGSIVINPSTLNATFTWVSGPVTSPVTSTYLPAGATDERELTNLAPGTYCVNISGPSPGTTVQTLANETFEDNGVNWTIDNSNGANQFVINNTYTGGSCVTGAGTFTVPVVPNQPAAVTSGPTSKYLHIKATTTSGVTCGAGSSSPFPPLNANFDGTTSDQKATLNTNIVTSGLTNITVTFYWLGKGDASGNDYGALEYSTNNGSTWTQAGAKLYNQTTWILATRTNAAWDNQPSLKFRIRWRNNATSSTDPPIAIDQFKVTGEQTVSCTSTIQECFTITDPVAVAAPAASNVNLCQGSTTSALTATASGGGTLNWYGTNATGGTASATAPTPNTGTAGTTSYYVSQTVGGCESPRTKIDVTVTALPVLAISSLINPGCTGNDGGFTITASGGSGSGYTYSIDNGATFTSDNSPSTLPAGTYQVFVSDSAGCVSSATPVSLTPSSSPAFVISNQTDPSCGASNGAFTITASGGSGSGYTYSIDNGATYSSINILSGLAAGTYLVLVMDDDGCMSAASPVTLAAIDSPVLALSNITDPGCRGNDGGFDITASGGSGSGYTYSLDNGITYSSVSNPSSLTDGTYQVLVMDGTGCVSTVTNVSLASAGSPSVSAVFTNPTCAGNDGTITLTASGGSGSGYLYSIDSTAGYSALNSFTNLPTGNYYVMVIDDNACPSASIVVTLSLSNAPVAAVVNQTDPACGIDNGILSLSASGGSGNGYTFSIDNGLTYFASGNFTNLAAGNYSVVVKDGNGCVSSIVSVVLTMQGTGAPVVQAISGAGLICPGTTGVTFSVVDIAGSIYSWSVPTGCTIISGQGTYQISVDWNNSGGDVALTETNACGVAYTTFSVNVNNIIPTSDITGTLSVCPNTGGLNYTVDNPNPGSTFSWSITGGTIISGNGTSNIVVDWGGIGTGVITVVEQTVCGNLTPRTLNCIINDPPVAPTIQFVADEVCSYAFNQVYSVVNNPTSNYIWSVPAGATIVSGQGTNSIVVDWGDETSSGPIAVSELAFCGSNFSVHDINVLPLPAEPVISGPSEVCPGQTSVNYTVVPFVGSTYSWAITNGSVVSGNGTASIYVDWGSSEQGTLTVSQNNQCGVTTPDVLNVLIHSVNIDMPAPRVICPGEIVPLTVNGSSQNYSWTPLSGLDDPLSASPMASPTETTTYTAITMNSCALTDTVTIIVKPLPQPAFTADLSEHEIYSSVQFINNTPAADSYLWNIGSDSVSGVKAPNYVFKDTGWINVVLTASLNGCIDSVSRPVYIKDIPLVFIPNAFSPNSDIVNDYFKVVASGYKKIDVYIFDRWGKMIKEWHNFNEGWDGTVKGDPVPIDVYEYKVILYEELDSKGKSYIGTLNLIR